MPLIDPTSRLEVIVASILTINAQQLPVTNARWLLDVRAVNMSGGDLFLMIFDANSPVANNAVPIWGPYPVPGSATVRGFISEDFGIKPLLCTKTPIIAWSSTLSTLTLAGGGPIYASGGR